MDDKYEDESVMHIITKPLGSIYREKRENERELDELDAIKYYGLKPSMEYTPIYM